MSWGATRRAHRPRELRRRVLIPARLRTDAGWADACILNISSGGLMIRAARPVTYGSLVELRRDDQAIHARVVWRNGARVGLKAENKLPVGSIINLQTPDVQIVTPRPPPELRRNARSIEQGRMLARAAEYVAAVIVAASLAIASLGMVEQAIARPLALVSLALGG